MIEAHISIPSLATLKRFRFSVGALPAIFAQREDMQRNLATLLVGAALGRGFETAQPEDTDYPALVLNVDALPARGDHDEFFFSLTLLLFQDCVSMSNPLAPSRLASTWRRHALAIVSDPKPFVGYQLMRWMEELAEEIKARREAERSEHQLAALRDIARRSADPVVRAQASDLIELELAARFLFPSDSLQS